MLRRPRVCPYCPNTGIRVRSHRNSGHFYRIGSRLFCSGPTKEPFRDSNLAIDPHPTTFIVNVIHVHPGKQDEAFRLIQDVVHYVAELQPGFRWSNLARSTDGLTVVNIEAIADADDVGTFFADPLFREKFALLDTVSTSEFHTYTVGDLVLPKSAS